MPDSSGSVDLGSLPKEEQEKVEQMADQDPNQEKQRVLTAFSVVVSLDGNPQVVSLESEDFEMTVPPTADLIYGAAHTIIKDISGQEYAHATAMTTVQTMMAQTRMMAEQQQAQQVAAQLGDVRRAGR